MTEENIMVNMPYYNYEFSIPWTECQCTVSHLLTTICQRAVREVRYANLLIQPTFSLYSPGRPALLSEALINDELIPGSLVLALTDEEARTFLSTESADAVPTFSAPSTTLLSRMSVSRINARYEELMRRTPAQVQLQAPEDEEDEDEGDEEYVAPETTPDIQRTMRLLTAMLGMGSTNPGIITGTSQNIKKVINQETFLRVCPIMSQAEIASLTTITEYQDPAVTEENDTIGGPCDAGLGACSVCLGLLVNRLKTPGEIRKMPNCSHFFHSHCLSEWLTHNAITCPVCREPAVTDRKDYGYLGYGTRAEEYTPATSISAAPAPASQPPIRDWQPAEFPHPARFTRS